MTKSLPLPAKIIFWAAGAIVALYGFAQAVEYFYDKYMLHGPGLHNAAHAWWKASPWKATFAVAVSFSILAGVVAGIVFWFVANEPPAVEEQVSSKDLSSRPYLVVEPGAINNFHPSEKTGVYINLRNTGQSPAFDLVIERYISIQPWPLPDETPFPKAPQPDGSGPVTVVPGGQFTSYVEFDTPLGEKPIMDVINGTSRLYIAVLLKYKDQPGAAERRTSLVACVGGQRLVEGIQRFKTNGNSSLLWDIVPRFSVTE